MKVYIYLISFSYLLNNKLLNGNSHVTRRSEIITEDDIRDLQYQIHIANDINNVIILNIIKLKEYVDHDYKVSEKGK